jgi:predicted secreted hydrolase
VPARLRAVPTIGGAGLAGLLALGIAAGPLLAGCAPAGAPILANAPAPHPLPPALSPVPSAPADPRPVVLPADDAPHDRLTEWWYYTGHLATADGRRHFGFEYVIFRAERGAFPVSWASHLAVTDETAGTFSYAQRTEIGPQVEGLQLGPIRFIFEMADRAGGESWSLRGGGGIDFLNATAGLADVGPGTEPGFGIDLRAVATKPAALHNRTGWIDFGAGGSSYYYSRTAMDARGTLTLDGEDVAVTGEAWFDHQWGDFITVGGGGWDWFAVNLADGTDVTLSLVRDADG